MQQYTKDILKQAEISPVGTEVDIILIIVYIGLQVLIQQLNSIICGRILKIREFSHEKEFAPEGKNIFQTMTYCVESDACEFIELRKDKTAYRDKKKSIAADIEKIITTKFSELKDKIKCIDVWTPATYRRYTQSEIGSYMSFAFPAKTFPTNVSNRIKGLKNVILATQWLQSPGGLPIAAKAGQRAIETLMKIDRKKVIPEV